MRSVTCFRNDSIADNISLVSHKNKSHGQGEGFLDAVYHVTGMPERPSISNTVNKQRKHPPHLLLSFPVKKKMLPNFNYSFSIILHWHSSGQLVN